MPDEAEVMEYLSRDLWDIMGSVADAQERCKANILLANTWVDDFLVNLHQRLRKVHHEAVITEADLYMIPNWRQYYGLEMKEADHA